MILKITTINNTAFSVAYRPYDPVPWELALYNGDGTILARLELHSRDIQNLHATLEGLMMAQRHHDSFTTNVFPR